MRKKKLAFLTLVIAAMALGACGGDDPSGGGGTGGDKKKCTHEWGEGAVTTEATEVTDGELTYTCSLCGKTKTESIPKLGFPYSVVFKDASGAVISSETLRTDAALTKPADPVAPEGQVFYGWMNVKNGGQIWDFDNEILNKVADDIELQPLFVPAGRTTQYLEAEFAPDITANGGMDGATYSGGAKGKQFIMGDDNYEHGSTCEQGEFHYYMDPDLLEYVAGDTAPAGEDLMTANPKESRTGYFVHYNYKKGNTLTFNINVSEAVDDVVIFARLSAEYGQTHKVTFDRYCSFSETSFPISVNGTPLTYGTVTMHNIPEVGGYLPFQDYFLSATVSLKAGANVITMKVDNTDTVNGTIASTSPVIDSLKILTTATITWDEAKLANIIK